MKIEKVMERWDRVNDRNIWYKLNGHGGYQDIDKGWRKRVFCYSTICDDDTETLCKIPKPREFSRADWNRMVRMVKKVSTGVRQSMNDRPPSFEENTMYFGSGSGYCDYFAFVLWRLFYFSPEMWNLIEYLHYQHGYKLHDAYILSSLFVPREWYVAQYYQIIDKLYDGFVREGVAKRLKNASRLKYLGNYSMARSVRGSTGKHNKMIIFKKQWIKVNINDVKFMDTIVEFINR